MDNAHLQQLLEALAVPGATDLHLKPGSPPRVRRKGVLETVAGEQAMNRADVANLALALFGGSDPAAQIDGGIAATHAVDGVGRFRVRAYRQRGSIALVVKRIPDTVDTLEELGLPTRCARWLNSSAIDLRGALAVNDDWTRLHAELDRWGVLAS